MSKEREAFEIFYKSSESQYHKALDNYDTDFDCYPNDYIQCRYFYWQAAQGQAVPECTWKQNEDGVYDTSCTNYFVFPEPGDRPSDHDFTHCCFCGGQLIEAQHPCRTSDCPDEP